MRIFFLGLFDQHQAFDRQGIDEVIVEMLKDLNGRLEDRLILTAIDSLPPDKQEELEQMAESGAGAGDMEAFVKTNIANWEQVFSQALVEFRESYLGKGQ